MKLKTYLRSLTPEDRRDFARRVGTSSKYLSHLCTGFRRAGLETIIKIERESGGKVTGKDLRPDLQW